MITTIRYGKILIYMHIYRMNAEKQFYVLHLRRKEKMELSYRKALKGDAPLLIDIYNSSFYDDYIRYGECPAYGRTKEKMEQSIAEFPKYIIIKDNIPVGVL